MVQRLRQCSSRRHNGYKAPGSKLLKPAPRTADSKMVSVNDYALYLPFRMLAFKFLAVTIKDNPGNAEFAHGQWPAFLEMPIIDLGVKKVRGANIDTRIETRR